MIELKDLKLECEDLCQKHRSPSQFVKILAVSKLQSEESIRRLHSQGQTCFGENYVQEALQKMADLKDLNLEWHFIGHIQKNKIKHLCGNFTLLHSLSTWDTIIKLESMLEKLSLTQKILIQVNLASEMSKDGFSVEELKKYWPQLMRLKKVQILGLMTMPPLFEDPEKARPFFRSLRLLRDELKSKLPSPIHPCTELSMGTSHDFRVAIEEGSTYIRIGTALFGERKIATEVKHALNLEEN